MKKLAAVAVLSMCAASAYAAGPGPSVSISGYSGNIHGTVSSVSTGSSVVSTQVNGYGSSSQTSFGETGGVAQASGSFSHNGIETVTSTRQYATSDTYGHVSGNAPIMVGDSIANGGATFEKTDTNASATGSFHAATFGATASIQGSEGLATSKGSTTEPAFRTASAVRARDIMKTIVLALSLSLAAFSATAQTNSASSSTTSATSGATNAGNTQGITFNSKSDASGTLRTAPAMGGQSFYGSFSSDSCMVSAGGAARSSASA